MLTTGWTDRRKDSVISWYVLSTYIYIYIYIWVYKISKHGNVAIHVNFQHHLCSHWPLRKSLCIQDSTGGPPWMPEAFWKLHPSSQHDNHFLLPIVERQRLPNVGIIRALHDDIMTWKHYQQYLPFVYRTYWWIPLTEVQKCRPSMFLLLSAWTSWDTKRLMWCHCNG